MRARFAVLATLILLSLSALAQNKAVYFSVTTNKTFRPNEKPKVELYAHNVDVLEFRVYRVNDPLKFFQQLDNVHHFGPEYSPKEQVDERTWLEKFHDWKMGLWRWIRNFFRHQYSAASRAEIRERHSVIGKRSGVSANEFAAVPLLNSQQLVARWKLDLPPNYVSESSDLPMDSLPSGVYVLEATNGTYRAYTVIVVSEMALVTKTSRGRIMAYTADREMGRPIGDTTVTT